MRYAQIRSMDISNGEGIGIALFTQGCDKHCIGCFNPETWDFKAGKEFTEETRQAIFQLLDQPHITRLSLLGGEPLAKQNCIELSQLLLDIKFKNPQIKIWLWTGYTWEQLLKIYDMPEEEFNKDLAAQRLCVILFLTDVLIDGPFIQEERDITLKWRGSRNQRVIDVQQSFIQNKLVLYTE